MLEESHEKPQVSMKSECKNHFESGTKILSTMGHANHSHGILLGQ
jgi:hypothetical protein